VLLLQPAGDSRLLEPPVADGLVSGGATWPPAPGQPPDWRARDWDMVLARLPGGQGAEQLLDELQRSSAALPLIVLADGVDPAREMALLQAGCAEVLDGARSGLLPELIRRVWRAARERDALARIREELLRSAQRFEAVFAHAPTAVLVADSHTLRVSEANPMALRMFDVDAGTMASRPLSGWIEAGDRGLFHEALQRVLVLREPRVRVELRLRRSDSSLFWGDMSLGCLDSPSADAPSLIVNLLNISLHKQAQAAAAGMQAELELRVRDKTADLLAQRRRLEALYGISSMVAAAPSLAQLAGDFVAALRELGAADAVALRDCSVEGEPGEVLAACGAAFDTHARDAARAPVDVQHGAHVLELRAHGRAPARGALQRLVRVPVAAQRRLLAVVDLGYARAAGVPSPEDLPLLEAAAGHLAAGLEALRSSALEREAAVTQERGLLARELHDSIAQALAFMNIQLELLRTALRADDPARVAAALDELEAGLRESTEDVRELLLHFRTRSSAEDIAPAIRSTVQKFELQCSVPVSLEIDTRGRAMDADVQVQLLHILQEALSNVRKHARASAVAVSVSSVPHWRVEVRDDGVGFDAEALGQGRRAQVGMQIMRERAAQIGATVQVRSAPAAGTEVLIELGG
jgi:PAS domain S-box-containing protein